MSHPVSPGASANRRPGWRLVPWALLLTIGGFFLLVAVWKFAAITSIVLSIWPGGPATMSLDMLVAFGRTLLTYVAIFVSGLSWCVCAFRCRRGAWRSAFYTALLAVVLLATSYVILASSQVE